MHVACSVIHIANAGDAVGQEQREVPILSRDRLVGSIHRHVGDRMDVHVPHARNQVAALHFHDVDVPGCLNQCGGPYGNNPFVLDKNYLVRTERAVDDIHNRGPSDGKIRGCRVNASSGQEHACCRQHASHSEASEKLQHLSSA
jgi:hypothetical protein